MATTVYSGFDRTANRLELFIRIVYGFIVSIFVSIYGFVIGIWAMALSVVQIIHWFYILIYGKRWEFANKHTTTFINFAFGRFYLEYLGKKVAPYMWLLTDKRPGFSV